MKRFAFSLVVVALIASLGGCLSLKPFTQDELSRLSATGAAAGTAAGRAPAPTNF
jgi:hypothetical protein